LTLARVRSLDNEIGDGTNYGRTSQLDLYSSGGFNRVGLRVAGSGHRIGDQRNLTMRLTGNIQASVPTVITYSASTGTPATATISVAAFTMLAGSYTVAYNAMSVGVTGTAGTLITYFLYFDDAASAGGTQTLVATTNKNDIFSGDGRVYVGGVVVQFPSSGTGSGTGAHGGIGGAVQGATSSGPSPLLQ
ncbi:MAG: hypothetical protein KGO96_14105, partial [Elusimicrobia bacterium]|nr:hypothetical protein [Elusimicrobiota bacterium]